MNACKGMQILCTGGLCPFYRCEVRRKQKTTFQLQKGERSALPTFERFVHKRALRSAVGFAIFTFKGQDTKVAARLIEPIVVPRTAIISFQNGVEWLDILSGHFSPENMIPGTTMTPAVIEKPGVICHIGSTRPITIGEWNGEQSKRLQRFADLYSRAGLDVTMSGNTAPTSDRSSLQWQQCPRLTG